MIRTVALQLFKITCFLLLLLTIFSMILVFGLIPTEIVKQESVFPLPGKLDQIPVFNSNSPELVGSEGILLSTFPPQNKRVPAAHLNFPFQGRFDIFCHHFTALGKDGRTLYLGVLLQNLSRETVTIKVLQSASYLAEPEAPYLDLFAIEDNFSGDVYSGPGDRVMNDILRGKLQNNLPITITLLSGESQMLINLPLMIQENNFPQNGRSTFLRLASNGPVYVASLAMYAPVVSTGISRAPMLAEWKKLLDTGQLVEPRDQSPTPLNNTMGHLIYGRVAGVAQGSQWEGTLIDQSSSNYLTIPPPGQAFSYVISSVHQGTLGTQRIQSAKMLVRYPDTAYFAHGNYGVQYHLTIPFYNPTDENQIVGIALQTPIKENQLSKNGLRFRLSFSESIAFRGTVRLNYQDFRHQPQIRYLHLWQHRGEQAGNLVTLMIKPGDRRLVKLDFIYPPDATPPQVLTVSTSERNYVIPIMLKNLFFLLLLALVRRKNFPKIRG